VVSLHWVHCFHCVNAVGAFWFESSWGDCINSSRFCSCYCISMQVYVYVYHYMCACDGRYGRLIVEALPVVSVVNCQICSIIPPFHRTLKWNWCRSLNTWDLIRITTKRFVFCFSFFLIDYTIYCWRFALTVMHWLRSTRPGQYLDGWMWAGTPSRYVTGHQGQLSLPSLQSSRQ